MYHNTVIQQENAVMAVVGNVSTGYVRHVRRTRDYTVVISMQGPTLQCGIACSTVDIRTF